LIESNGNGDGRLRRFEREVQLTASLAHPNVIAVYDYGHTREETFYYAMELVAGATLAELVAESGPQPSSRVIHLLHQAASALVEAHGAGLVHRDIKPANLMVHGGQGVRDILKVLDFGLVKEFSNESSQLSRSDVVSGTPHYLSPEAIASPANVGPASDIYALGCVAYFLLTGSEVFEGETLVRVCADHLHRAPIPPSQRLGRTLPEALETLVLRCLEKDPQKRPQSSAALRSALEAVPLEPWSEAEKDEWWEQHEASLAKRRARVALAGPRTIELASESSN
jgi:serine/threonine-protein kinase